MVRKKTIAFFGSSLVSSYWNGAATYYRGIIRALHDKGYCTTFYEPDAYDRQKFRDTVKVEEYAKSVVYSADLEGVKRALTDAAQAALIIKASGVGAFDMFLEHAVLELKNAERKVLFWDVDAPATLDRLYHDPTDYFIDLVKEYDGVLTYGGGDPVKRRYKNFGARFCLPIYNACDPDIHFRTNPDPRFRSTLAFLGNRMPDREKRVWEFFFSPAQQLPNHTFLLGGNGWHENCPAEENITYIGHVETDKHNAFNSTPLAVLNINRQSMAQYGYSPPTRIFEAAGAGACIITDAWQGIDHFLEPHSECLVAENAAEVVNHIQSLTKEKAAAIGHAAQQRILHAHTYKQRAEVVEACFENVWSEKKEIE